ncbi:MAG: hypothetical protein ACI8Z5_000222 [Lentimonas sp.]|jgi:hypothetical protein
MSEPLEELRAQRALIQQHLDWLDARIATTRGSGAEQLAQPAAGQVVAATPAPSVADTTPAVRPPPPAVRPPPPAAAETPKVTGTPVASFFDIDKNAYSTSSTDVRKAQIGCFIFFVLATLAFLLLLFGLPYFVD